MIIIINIIIINKDNKNIPTNTDNKIIEKIIILILLIIISIININYQ